MGTISVLHNTLLLVMILCIYKYSNKFFTPLTRMDCLLLILVLTRLLQIQNLFLSFLVCQCLCFFLFWKLVSFFISVTLVCLFHFSLISINLFQLYLVFSCSAYLLLVFYLCNSVSLWLVAIFFNFKCYILKVCLPFTAKLNPQHSNSR